MLKQVSTFGFSAADNSLLNLLLKGDARFIFKGSCNKFSDLHGSDVLLMHLRTRSSIEVTPIKTIKETFPKISVLVTGKFLDLWTIQTILRAGANGYILKTPNNFSHILSALTELTNGGGPLSPQVARILIKSFQNFEKQIANPY